MLLCKALRIYKKSKKRVCELKIIIPMEDIICKNYVHIGYMKCKLKEISKGRHDVRGVDKGKAS